LGGNDKALFRIVIMKIGVDVRCLMNARRTGVEEYTLSLLLNLLEIDQKNEYVLFLNSFKKTRFNFDIFLNYKNVVVKRFRVPNKLLNLSFWFLNWPKIDEMMGGMDLFFMPNIIFGCVSRKTKLILTMHDLSFERHPGHFSWKRRLWHIFINPQKLCKRADKIIAVSDSTKNDLVSVYKLNLKKVETVYSAVANDFNIISRNDKRLIEVQEKYKLPYKFILYLGTIEPRKNIIAAVKAFDRFHKFAYVTKNNELLKYKLVIAGEKGWLSEKIFEEIKTSPSQRSIYFIGKIPKNNKICVYNLASLFVYPSCFEGFGFPPLEAMKCGVPVIAGNNSSLPEVIGAGGILIDSDRPDEIYRAMKEILADKDFKEILITKGLKKAEEFCWKNTASKYLDIINKIGII
jgi:glycosyltransferase involved in cell wall biosynthesis